MFIEPVASGAGPVVCQMLSAFVVGEYSYFGMRDSEHETSSLSSLSKLKGR